MKICLITETFYPDDSDPVAILLSQLMRHLQDTYADLKIDVVTSVNLFKQPCERLALYEYWDGIQIFRVNTPRKRRSSMAVRLLAGVFFSMTAALKVRRLHRQECYDLIVFGTNPPSLPLIGQLMSFQYAVPYLYLVHDLFPDIAISMKALRGNSVLVRVARKLQKSWLSEAKAVVAIGRCMNAVLTNTYQIDPEKVHVITNWSDVDAIVPQSKETAFRNVHNLSGFLVIYSGNIGHAQKLNTVLSAARLLQKTHSDVTFVLVGGGAAWNDLAWRIHHETITNVRMIPSVPMAEYPSVLASADISLVSLDSTILGLAVPSKSYNILASGRPMIAILHRESEIAHVMREHHCGIQVDHDNGIQLANSIIMMHDGGSLLLNQMGQYARNACTESYTLQIIADQYYRLFHELVKQSDNPSLSTKIGVLDSQTKKCSHVESIDYFDKECS